MKKSFVESTRDFVSEWTVTILILLFGTTTLMQAFVVPTSSMESTVLVGDHMIVDKLAYSPAGAFSRHILPYRDVRRGDIIVFKWPPDPRQNYVKRVMGVPGDHIKVVNKEVFLNGKKLVEPYTQHIFPNIEPYRDNFPAEPFGPVDQRGIAMLKDHVVNGELVVPPDSYFAMGDNRDNSLDSRYWGFVPRENIVGKPFAIFWSYDAPTEDLVDFTAKHFIDLAQNFFTKTRWSRTLKLVRAYPVE
ncbi:MAG: signal peptidase I [Acidobacteria bacterium]|nr:signal peptidase I [Acidobacteriota bacterium]